MANGSKIDVVEITSDALHELNMALSDHLPNEPGFDELEEQRDELIERLKTLVRESFKNNTKRFISADSQLVTVNKQMKTDLQSLKNLEDAIDSVTKLISSLDSFIGAVFPTA